MFTLHEVFSNESSICSCPVSRQPLAERQRGREAADKELIEPPGRSRSGSVGGDSFSGDSWLDGRPETSGCLVSVCVPHLDNISVARDGAGTEKNKHTRGGYEALHVRVYGSVPVCVGSHNGSLLTVTTAKTLGESVKHFTQLRFHNSRPNPCSLLTSLPHPCSPFSSLPLLSHIHIPSSPSSLCWLLLTD